MGTLKTILLSVPLILGISYLSADSWDYKFKENPSKVVVCTSETGFTLRASDLDSDGKTDYITLSDNGEGINFDRTLKTPIKVAQYFDVADKILYFNEMGESPEKANNYLEGIKSRFIEEDPKKAKSREKVSLNEFFGHEPQSRDNVENLISDSFDQFQKLVDSFKKANQNFDLDNFFKHIKFGDKLRFLVLAGRYKRDLRKLDYELIGCINEKNIYEVSLEDLSNSTFLKLEINFDSFPKPKEKDSIRGDVTRFLNDNNRRNFFVYNGEGKYQYGIVKRKEIEGL